MSEIARQARVTEGAVFHHFASKRDLLREVFEVLEQETVAELEQVVRAEPSSEKRFAAAVDAFLSIGARPEKRQIAFRDAPSVLGWETVREIQSRHALPLVTELVAELVDSSRSQLVAELLLAQVAEAAMVVERSSDPEETRRQLRSILVEFVVPRSVKR